MNQCIIFYSYQKTNVVSTAVSFSNQSEYVLINSWWHKINMISHIKKTKDNNFFKYICLAPNCNTLPAKPWSKSHRYTEDTPPSKYISLYWSKAWFASISSFLKRSDGIEPSSNGGSYVLLHGDLQTSTWSRITKSLIIQRWSTQFQKEIIHCTYKNLFQLIALVYINIKGIPTCFGWYM